MDIDRLVKSLSRQPLFKETPEEVLFQVASQSKIRHLENDEALVNKGDPSDSLFIIRRGWLKILGDSLNGQEVVLNHVGPGQIIGEMSVIDQLPRSNTVTALKGAEVLEIKYVTILEVINQYPILAISLLQEMASRVRFANAYIEETIQWCQHIATGDYDFVQGQVQETKSTIVGLTQSHQARASAFLSVFFKMIEEVKQREDELKQQVQKLTIEIDETKRQRTVSELTDTNFFADLKAAAQRIRAERDSKRKK